MDHHYHCHQSPHLDCRRLLRPSHRQEYAEAHCYDDGLYGTHPHHQDRTDRNRQRGRAVIYR